MITHYLVIDRAHNERTENAQYFWREIVLRGGIPVAVRYRHNMDHQQNPKYCSICGAFGHTEFECPKYPQGEASKEVINSLAEGWKTGRNLGDEYYNCSLPGPKGWLQASE